MFGWFSKKTDLETFCASLTVEKAAALLQERENENGLRLSLAVLLLYAAHHFWESLAMSSELKTYTRKTSSNVVMFESLVYVWNHLSTDIEKFIEENELQEDDPISGAVTDSLHISMAFMTKYWSNFTPDSILKSRIYPQSPLKSMEKFSGHLLSSYGQKFPAPYGQGSDELNSNIATQLYLMAHIGPFTKVFLPSVAETTRRMATLVAESR